MDRLTNTLRIIIHAGLYLILLTPLIVWSRFRFPHLTGKVLAFQILVEIVAVAAIVLFLLEWDLKKNRDDRPGFRFLSPLAIALIVFYVYSLVSALFGVSFRDSFWGRVDRQDGLWLLLHFLLWFLVLIWFSRHSQLKPGTGITRAKASKRPARRWKAFGILPYVNASFWVSALVSLISVSSWLIYAIWGLSPGALVTSGSARAGGTFGNPFAIGPYLLFHFFYGFSYMREVTRKDVPGAPAAARKHSGRREAEPSRLLLSMIPSSQVMILGAIVLSQTRGVILGLLLGLLVLGTASIFNRSLSFRVRVLAACALLILLGGSLGIWSLRNQQWVKDNRVLRRITDVSITETRTLQMRFLTWQSGLQGFRENPVFGWGHNNIYYVLNKHYNPEHVRFGRDFRNTEVTWWDKSHNSYVDLLVEKGLVGFALFLGLIGILARTLWQLKTRFTAVCLGGGFIAYGTSNLVAFDSFGSFLACFLIMGLMSALTTAPASFSPEKSARAAKKKKRVPTVRIGFASSLSISAILLVGFIGLYANVKTGIASAGYNRARVLFQSDAVVGLNQYNRAFTHFSPYSPRENLNCAYLIVNALITKKLDLVAGDNLDRALRLAEKSESALPSDPLVHMVLNEIYNGLGIYVDEKYLVRAEAAGDKALLLSPRRQEVMFNLGRTYVLAGKPQMAIDLNRSMIDQYPDLPRAHWLLGLALLANEEQEAAKESIEKALMIGYWFKNPEEEKTVADLFGKAGFNNLMRKLREP